MNIKELFEGVEPELPGAPEGIQIMTPQQFIAKSAQGEEPEPEEEVSESKMAELDMDLDDPELSDREFEKIYGLTRREAREEFSRTNTWDFPDFRDPNKKLHEQGVAKGFPHDVDHMPGKTVKHQDTNCTTCHGRKSMYKLGGKLFSDNKPGAAKVKCPSCRGTGEKQGVAEAAKWRHDDLEGKTWRSADWDDGDLSPGKIQIDRHGKDVDDSGDELNARPGMWGGKYKRMTKKGTPTQHELGMQNNTKMRMKMQNKQGGLTGPKGRLPEE